MNFKQWLNLQEAKIGDLFDRDKPNYKVKFDDVKFDTIDKYHVDLKKSLHNIYDINQIKIGDKIQDFVSMSNAEYWEVIDIDIDKNILYLKPIKNNPFKPNASGEVIGAGGNKFSQHDFDVMSGEFEKERIDSLLDVINKKKYHDVSNISYILLGTVPVHVGPNGSQGGGYSVASIHNRGKSKGMETEEIIAKDADTIKNKLKLSIPEKALNGSIEPSAWNNFVNSSLMSKHELESSKLPEEDFSNPQKMAEIILSHMQPYIRDRNADILITAYKKDKSLLPLIKNVAFELAKQPSYGSFDSDKNRKTKEKFINLANREKWLDVLDAFHESPNPTNRSSVAYGFEKNESLDSLIKMMNKETSSEALEQILRSIYNIIFKEIEDKFFVTKEEKLKIINANQKSKEAIDLICKNKEKLKKIIDSHDYHSKDGNIILSMFTNFCQ